MTVPSCSGGPFDPPPRPTTASDILDATKATITGPRAAEYGPPDENFGRIAAMWSVILGQEVTAEQVALCMVQVKITRLIQTANHPDSWLDIAGYAALGGQIAATPGRYV